MALTLATLAAQLDGTLISGDPTQVVTAAEVAYAADAKALARVAPSATVLLLGQDLEPGERAAIRVAHARRAFLRMLQLFDWRQAPAPGIHPTAVIAASATVPDSVAVGPYAVIGERAVVGAGCVIGAHAVIGDDVVLGEAVTMHAHATIYPRCTVGHRVILHAGAVIGADGFGYERVAEGHQKIPQVGTVVIEDDVEIGANTTIDRATADSTVIGQGSKLDNLVHVAHNVRLGARALVMAQVGIAGSTTLGDDVVLAGQVGVGDHVTIGDRVIVAAKSGVSGIVPAGVVYSGIPGRPHGEQLRKDAAVLKLPALRNTVRALERRLAELEAQLAATRDEETPVAP